MTCLWPDAAAGPIGSRRGEGCARSDSRSRLPLALVRSQPVEGDLQDGLDLVAVAGEAHDGQYEVECLDEGDVVADVPGALSGGKQGFPGGDHALAAAG